MASPTIQFKDDTPQLFLLGNVQFYAVFTFEYTTANKVATYEYPFVDGVDYSMVGVGEQELSITGRILSFTNYGAPHLTQIEQILAQVQTQEPQDFAHPEIGAFRVIVDRFTLDQSGGTEGYSFTLVMKKVTTIREKEVAQEVAEQKAAATSSTTSKTHTVVKGESLWRIAQRTYGDGRLWTKLWDANKTALRSKKPHLIYPGEVLTLP